MRVTSFLVVIATAATVAQAGSLYCWGKANPTVCGRVCECVGETAVCSLALCSGNCACNVTPLPPYPGPNPPPYTGRKPSSPKAAPKAKPAPKKGGRKFRKF